MSRDPIGEDGGLNLYGFVGNDAVNLWDLLGLDWEEVGATADNRRVIWSRPKADEEHSLDKLADKLKLDKSETEKWAKEIEGSNKCRYSVPNVCLVADLLSGQVESSGLFGRLFNTVVNTGDEIGAPFVCRRGNERVKVGRASEVVDAIGDYAGDLLLFGVFGHGAERGTRIYEGDHTSWVDAIDVFDALKQNGFQLSKVYAMQCYSGSSAKAAGLDWASVSFLSPKLYEGVNFLGLDSANGGPPRRRPGPPGK